MGALNPEPSTRNPKPETLNPNPLQTRSPKPFGAPLKDLSQELNCSRNHLTKALAARREKLRTSGKLYCRIPFTGISVRAAMKGSRRV